ncbi:hypothetical protein WICPIJ_002628 [Wickerhamomyces pijperi]|uniref:Uncharacterized protein n=1 Tax=Wickerhamomyces pijperi TaxID=599730 RepID=A0A9P8TNU1_WICPI|nr:hypothetical protein WICPIJ_002628 [Wickerhamomyces pijperi]
MALHRIPTQSLQDLISSTKNNTRSIACPLPTLDSAYLNGNGFMHSHIYEFNGLNNSGKFALINGIINGMPEKKDILWISSIKIASRRIPTEVDNFWCCNCWAELYLFLEYVTIQPKTYRLIIIEDYYDFIKFEPSTYKQNINIHKTLNQIHLLANKQQVPVFLLNMVSPVSTRFIKTEISEESQEFMNQSRDNFNKSLVNQQILSPYTGHPAWSNYITVRFVLFLDWRPEDEKGGELCYHLVSYSNMDRVISFETDNNGDIRELLPSVSAANREQMSFVAKEKQDGSNTNLNNIANVSEEEFDSEDDADLDALISASFVKSKKNQSASNIDTTATTLRLDNNISNAKKLLEESQNMDENSTQAKHQQFTQEDVEVVSGSRVPSSQNEGEEETEEADPTDNDEIHSLDAESTNVTSQTSLETQLNHIQVHQEIVIPTDTLSSSTQVTSSTLQVNVQNQNEDVMEEEPNSQQSPSPTVDSYVIEDASESNNEACESGGVIQMETKTVNDGNMLPESESQSESHSQSQSQSQTQSQSQPKVHSSLESTHNQEAGLDEVASSQAIEDPDSKIFVYSQSTNKLLAALDDAIVEQDTLTTFMSEINETVNQQTANLNIHPADIIEPLENIKLPVMDIVNTDAQSTTDYHSNDEESSPNYPMLETPSPSQNSQLDHTEKRSSSDTAQNEDSEGRQEEEAEPEPEAVEEEDEHELQELEIQEEFEELYPTQPESLTSIQMSQIPSIKRHSSSLGIRTFLNKRQRMLRDNLLDDGTVKLYGLGDSDNLDPGADEADSTMVLESQPYF